MVPSELRLGIAASLAVLSTACMGQELDAGTTYVAKVGTTVTTRATVTAMVEAVTMDADSLYFTSGDGWIYSLSKQGTEPPQQVASFPGGYAWGIAVDDTSVYVTALVDEENGGVLLRAPKAGGTSSILASAQSRPWGVAVDDTQIFWMQQGATPYENSDDDGSLTAGALLALPKAGGKAKLLAGGIQVGDVLALDTESVYWHEDESIRSVSKKGGPITTLESSSVHTTTSNLIVADGQVVWAQSAGGASWTVSSVATTGGTTVTLEENVAQPSSLALLGSAVYWSDAGGSSAGEIQSVSTTGADQIVLSPQNASAIGGDRVVSFVLADANAFYIVSYTSEPRLQVVIEVFPQ
jgi:hypothetical protein